MHTRFILLLFLIFTSCSSQSEIQPFFNSIIGKTYYIWQYDGNICTNQVLNIYENGQLIQYNDSDNFTFDLTFQDMISSYQAIYLQKSAAGERYIALSLADNGNKVYYAFNPDSRNTNIIDWDTLINYMRTAD